MTPTLADLAAHLHVPAESLEALQITRNGSGFQIPERDAAGNVIGTAVRYDDDRKGSVKGSKRGLTMRPRFEPGAGESPDHPLLIVEGMSDTAAGLALGFETIGRPSATGGVQHLEAIAADKHVVIVGENDDSGIGAVGAHKIAAALSPVAASVRVVFPPEGAKDLRAWTSAKAPLTRDELLGRIEQAREWEHSDAPKCDSGTKGVSLRESNAARWKAVCISDLEAAPAPSWIFHGYIARGYSTLFCGLWKGGKTTLLAWMLREAGKGGGSIGTEVFACRVLYVTEESSGHWARRRDDLNIGPHVSFIVRPFLARPTHAEWRDFIAHLVDVANAEGFDLIVMDTLSKLWPCRDENDASQVDEALMPLSGITDAGIALMLVVHPRKGDANEAQATRGSGALPAYADTIVELRRFAPEEKADRRRVLTAYGRFDETPGEIVVELTEGGYRMVGSKAETKRADRLDVCAKLLLERPLEADGILANWPNDGVAKPGLRTLQGDLDYGVKTEMLVKTGEGKKGSPFVFDLSMRFRHARTLTAGIESGGAA